MKYQKLILAVAIGGLLAACAEPADLPVEAGIGASPQLPEPEGALIPMINIADAEVWPEGRTPVAAPGTEVVQFADDLDNPRWLYELPGGDVLVAESAAPPDSSPDGFKSWVAGIVRSEATNAGSSADRITLLRDTTGDGRADVRHTLVDNLYSPFGMEFIDGYLYVANADSVVRFPYQPGQTQITVEPELVTDLKLGTINHHWTKNLLASPDGERLYVAIGSNSNAAENGMAEEEGRAQIWEVDIDTGAHRTFASGLRNPVGMAWHPQTGELWTVVNERDELGGDLVPDYLTSVRRDGFYGWPWSYFGHHVDERVEPRRPGMVAEAIVPDYALGPHTASLGLDWTDTNALPAQYSNGMFIGQHGSWNREPYSGYKVIFVPFEGGMPQGDPIDVLTGFREGEIAYGRPVGVLVHSDGALLVADDVGNSIWRVTAAR